MRGKRGELNSPLSTISLFVQTDRSADLLERVGRRGRRAEAEAEAEAGGEKRFAKILREDP